MPIVIIEPGPAPPFNLPFEPGVAINATTDHIGPLGPNAFWTVEAWTTANPEHRFLIRRYQWTSNELRCLAYQPGINDPVADGEGLGTRPVQGNPSILRIQLDDPDTGFHEQQQVSVTFGEYDQSWRYTGTGVAVATVPPELLVDSHAAATQTVQEFGLSPTQVVTGIDKLITHPPLGLCSISVNPGLISGVGRLTPPQPPMDWIFGLWWNAVEVPVGFGLQPGVVRQWHERLVQLRVVFNLAGFEVCTEFFDFSHDQVLYQWTEPYPLFVDYYVTPGVVLDMRYLHLGGFAP